MIIFEVEVNAEGDQLCNASVEGDGCGYRISGPKPWGGSRKVAEVKIKESDMIEFIKCYCPHVMKALQAALKFIDSHAADPDLTSEMIENYAELVKMNPKKLLEDLEDEND